MNAGAAHRGLRRITAAGIALAWGVRALFVASAALTVGEMSGWAWIAALGAHLLVTSVAAPVEVLLALVLPWSAGAAARAEARMASWGEEAEVPAPARVAFDGIALWALTDAVLTVLSTAPWWPAFLAPAA